MKSNSQESTIPSLSKLLWLIAVTAVLLVLTSCSSQPKETVSTQSANQQVQVVPANSTLTVDQYRASLNELYTGINGVLDSNAFKDAYASWVCSNLQKILGDWFDYEGCVQDVLENVNGRRENAKALGNELKEGVQRAGQAIADFLDTRKQQREDYKEAIMALLQPYIDSYVPGTKLNQFIDRVEGGKVKADQAKQVIQEYLNIVKQQLPGQIGSGALSEYVGSIFADKQGNLIEFIQTQIAAKEADNEGDPNNGNETCPIKDDNENDTGSGTTLGSQSFRGGDIKPVKFTGQGDNFVNADNKEPLNPAE